MANLTPTQAQQLIDENKVLKRMIGEDFDCFHFAGNLEGYNYYVIEADPEQLDPDADKETVDAHFKTLLEGKEYLGAKPEQVDTPVV